MSDGINHINVYSKGNTELGRLLSNFAHTPFETPDDGKFASVEAYWYWLSCKDERLRSTHGFNAKKLGRDLGGSDWLEDMVFKNKIRLAIRLKIKQHQKIANMLKISTLPLMHYYVHNGNITTCPKAKWIIDEIELIRYELKSGNF